MSKRRAARKWGAVTRQVQREMKERARQEENRKEIVWLLGVFDHADKQGFNIFLEHGASLLATKWQELAKAANEVRLLIDSEAQ